jgi:hypothetical protein
MSMKNSNDTIGNRTRDLPSRNAVPQPTALVLFNIRHKYAVLTDATPYDYTNRTHSFRTQRLSSSTKLDQRCLTASHTLCKMITDRKPHTLLGPLWV